MSSTVKCAHISITLVLFLLPIASAHSNLGYPPPYAFRSCRIASDWCERKACPPTNIAPQLNSPEKPAAVWRRGQKVTITWHKNNHIGGFYRRSLVPVDHMYDHKWHAKTAFDYGCWSQGTFKCTKNKVLCGGDNKNRAYRNAITIPPVFPNGDYVFAQVWYGGLHWRGKYPNHSDYFACSFVKIVGDEPVEKEAMSSWTGKDKKCATGSTKPLQCGGHCGDACGGPKCPDSAVKTTVPEEFMFGVPKIVLANFNGKATAGAKSTVTKPKVANPPPPPAAAARTSTADGPLKSVRVYVNKQLVKQLQDGNRATIVLNGKDVAFEGYTQGKKVGTVSFKINGKKDAHEESNPPYVFRGNQGLQYNVWPKREVIWNREFELTVTLVNENKKYEKSVRLLLKP